MPNAKPVDDVASEATDTPGAASAIGSSASEAVDVAIQKAIADAVLRGDIETARAIADEVRRRADAERRAVLGKDVTTFADATRVLPWRKCK